MIINGIIFGWASLLFVYLIKKSVKYTNNYIIVSKYEFNKSYSEQLLFKTKLLYLNSFINLNIIIQSIFELINNKNVPLIINILIYSLTTNLYLIILFLLIIKYLKIFDKENIFLWKILLCITFCNTIINSFLQTYINYEIFKTVKILIYDIIIIISSIKINKVLLNIRSLLISDHLNTININKNILIYNIFISIILLYHIITSIINVSKKSNNTYSVDNIIYPIIEIISIIIINEKIIKKKSKTIVENKNMINIDNPIYTQELGRK